MLENTTLFLIINMLSGIGYSLVSPLFPTLGKKDNLSEGILGWIIGIFPISGSIFTPLVPILCKKFSRINLLCFATFCEASCTILYGLLFFISNFTLLMIIIFSLRILHGCCSAIIGTLVYSLTISLADKENTQSSLGKLEIAWAMGCSSGPLFASFFYNIGGYPLPFIASGICLYISVYLSKQINSEKLKDENEEKNDNDNNNINYFRYLFYKEIFLVLFGFVICMINVTFYYPCLTYHLTNNYSVSVSIASLFFITPVIPYIIILQYLDSISAKFGIYLTFTCGLILSGISSIFIYPVPPLPHSLIIIIIGFFIIGTGSVPVFIPGLVMLSNNIKKIDDNIDEMSANDIASAINTLCVELGDFLGPILGGFLTDKFGFSFCCFFVSMLGIAYSGIFIFFFFNKIKTDFNMVCHNKETERDYNEKENKIEKIQHENFVPHIKLYFSAGKYNIRSHSYKNLERTNNPRISLYSSITD